MTTSEKETALPFHRTHALHTAWCFQPGVPSLFIRSSDDKYTVVFIEMCLILLVVQRGTLVRLRSSSNEVVVLVKLHAVAGHFFV